MVTAAFKKNTTECIGNVTFGTDKHAACPAANSGYSAETTYLAGPVPAGGGSVSNLQAFTDAVPAVGASVVITVIDNTTGVPKLSCTITSASVPASSCSNNGSAPVAAGDYLEVQVATSNDNSLQDKHYRVSFRY
jgi:hypothetical protein